MVVKNNNSWQASKLSLAEPSDVVEIEVDVTLVKGRTVYGVS